jgi:prevent-host-death family protein
MLVNMLDAKTQLSKLVEAALRGEDVVIANRGKPVVRLVPAQSAAPRRRWGAWAGQVSEASVARAFTPEADAAIAAEFDSAAELSQLMVAEPRRRK